MSDLISRQAAIEVVSHVKRDEPWQELCINNVIRLLELLPPAERESWEELSCKGCKYVKYILGEQPLPCDHCIRAMADRYVAESER